MKCIRKKPTFKKRIADFQIYYPGIHCCPAFFQSQTFKVSLAQCICTYQPFWNAGSIERSNTVISAGASILLRKMLYNVIVEGVVQSLTSTVRYTVPFIFLKVGFTFGSCQRNSILICSALPWQNSLTRKITFWEKQVQRYKLFCLRNGMKV